MPLSAYLANFPNVLKQHKIINYISFWTCVLCYHILHFWLFM